MISFFSVPRLEILRFSGVLFEENTLALHEREGAKGGPTRSGPSQGRAAQEHYPVPISIFSRVGRARQLDFCHQQFFRKVHFHIVNFSVGNCGIKTKALPGASWISVEQRRVRG